VKSSYQTRAVVPVTITEATTKTGRFANAEVADIHFMSEFYGRYNLAALMEY
jgi:hypothetical protein